MEDSTVRSLADGDLDSIIDRLELTKDGFPVDAIEEARKRSKEITPHLIRLVEEATHDCRRGHLGGRFCHLLGTYLLAEFRAVEAWSTMREALRLPLDQLHELFGDSITEEFGCIIYTLAGDGLEEIETLISDRSMNEYVRWAACDTILYRVRDGFLTREDAIEWLARHLEKAIENKDEVAEGLVMRLEDLAAEDKLPLIKQAFAAGLIDEDVYPLSDVLEDICRGDKVVETMSRLYYPDGLIDHLQSWVDFDDQDFGSEFDGEEFAETYSNKPYESPGPLNAFEDDYISDNDTTVRNDGLKIGRNDKCPCGSGKKYKKCCGRSSSPGI